jgi:hypothetical protein
MNTLTTGALDGDDDGLTVTGFRVLDEAGPKVEVSIQTKGRLVESDYQGRETNWSGMQPGGFLFVPS